MIQEWFKELLIDGIISNLTGMFDTLNTKVGEIAGEVGMTPAAWNSSIFNMIRNLSETVIVPIAGMLVTLAVDEPDPLLNISDKRDALRRGLSLASSGHPSGNSFLDAFLGVVLSDSFRPGKPLLTFSTEGDVFAGLDFITGFLHEPQKVIVVLGCDDKPVDGLLELLLPARAAFGFGVLLVAHALVLRGRDIMDGLGPSQIARKLTERKILTCVPAIGKAVMYVGRHILSELLSWKNWFCKICARSFPSHHSAKTIL